MQKEIIPDQKDMDEIIENFNVGCKEVEQLKVHYPQNIYKVITCLDLYYLNVQMLYYTIYYAANDYSRIYQQQETIPQEEVQRYKENIYNLREIMETMRKDITKLIEYLKGKLVAEEMETLEYLQRLLNRPILDSFPKIL